MQQNQTQIEPWLNPSPPIYLVLAPQCPCEIDKMYRERCVELRSLNSACSFFAHCRDTSCVLMTTVLLPSSFVVIAIRRCIRLQVLFKKVCMFYKLTLDHAMGRNATLASRKTKKTQLPCLHFKEKC